MAPSGVTGENGGKMKTKNNTSRTCAICGKSFAPRDIVSGEIVRKEIAGEIMKSFPA